MTTDRIARLDTRTGQFVEYLLPRSTNIRRVFVDNTTTRPRSGSATTTALHREAGDDRAVKNETPPQRASWRRLRYVISETRRTAPLRISDVLDDRGRFSPATSLRRFPGHVHFLTVRVDALQGSALHGADDTIGPGDVLRFSPRRPAVLDTFTLSFSTSTFCSVSRSPLPCLAPEPPLPVLRHCLIHASPCQYESRNERVAKSRAKIFMFLIPFPIVRL